MHLAPNGKEGYLYTAEEVYAMLLSHGQKARTVEDGWDDHARWGTYGETSAVYEAWGKYFQDACTAIGERKQLSNGGLPMFAERLLEQMKAPQVDWRSVLNDFVQEDITDYSFSPPDKRFSDSPFLLPDYNERTDTVKNVWFFVDTSGSISLTELTLAYSEIKGAIEQFNGALRGKLAFFDASVKEPIYEFEDVDSLMKIKPVGGGGTSFYAVFKYVTKIVSDEQPSVIVILTDGQSAIPPEESARGIPVLWLLNDEKITPKWGKIARIKVENEGL
jgi:predicted metal-dependent peptidase